MKLAASYSLTKKNVMKLLAKFALIFSIICFVTFINIIITRFFPISKPKKIDVTTKKIPMELIIKDIAIDLPIIPARVVNGIFQTTTQGVSYLTSSPLPGNKGNSIIYAHNWWNLFAALPKVKQGEKIQILFSDKTKKTFTITATQTVSANTTSILQSTAKKQVTIFTCANFLDADRFVAIAMLQE